jgi:nucleoside-diphosphate-sugar epimerase
MRFLVTGHHGYIGSVAVPILAGAGHEVTGLDTYFYEGCDFVGDRVDVPTLSMDVRDVTEDALQWYDAIVHLAALSNSPLGESDAELTREINSAPPSSWHGRRRRQAAAASNSRRPAACTGRRGRTLRIRVVLQHVRGIGDGRPDDRASDCAPAYGLSGVEGAGGRGPIRARRRRSRPRLHAERHGIRRFSTRSLRRRAQQPGRAGFHQRQDSDHERRDALVATGPRGDIAATAAGLAAPVERIANQGFSVGANSENYRVRDLAEIVHETFPGCEIEYAEGAGRDPRSYRVDFSKLAAALPDAMPNWTARDGARELLDAFRSVGLTSRSFDTYTRLSRLKSLVETGSLYDELRWSHGYERT